MIDFYAVNALSSQLLIPIFIAHVVVVFLGSIGVRRGIVSKKTALVVVGIWGFVFFCYIFFLAQSKNLIDNDRLQKFISLTKSAKSIQLVYSPKGLITIRNIEDIVSLGQTIERAERNGPHHSYAIHRIKLFFPDLEFIYVIGQDSDNKDEYHLFLNCKDCADQTAYEVAQFFSPELTQWFKRQDVEFNEKK
ncbi:hypothetical protein K1X76_12805 [bacterium]|nr:hypothetical protein [bacterium]